MPADFVKRDKDVVQSKPDAQKSLAAKHLWGRHTHKFLKAIKDFHKSPEGRKLHRRIARFLATRNFVPKLDHNRELLSLRQEPKTLTGMKEHKFQIRDQFDVDTVWSISEHVETNERFAAEGVPAIDGKHILARVVGPGFLVNGISQNKRFYSRRLWENAMSKLKKILERGGSIGTIGHNQDLDEKAILEGKVSHLVTKVWIDDSDPSKPVGMVEALILGTPAGHILNSLMRAGYRIPVSSRAMGSYKGKGASGEDIIDEDSYEPITWDFVLSPGVDTAYLNIKESLEKQQQLEAGEETTMDQETMKKLTEERHALQADLSDAIRSNESLKEELRDAKNKAVSLAKIVEGYKTLVGSLDEAKRIDESLRKFLELEPLKSWYAEMGGLELVGGESGVRKLMGITEAFRKLGVSPKQLTEILEQRNQLNEKGSVEEVKKLMDVTESYMKSGSPKKVSEELTILKAYRRLGSIADIRKVFKVAEVYFKMGSPSKLQAKLDEAKKFTVKVREAQKKNVARKIAEAFDEPINGITEMLKAMPAEKVINILKERNEQRVVDKRYRVSENQKPVKGTIPSGPKTLAEKMFEDMR